MQSEHQTKILFSGTSASLLNLHCNPNTVTNVVWFPKESLRAGSC